jgi:hypothetical protein
MHKLPLYVNEYILYLITLIGLDVELAGKRVEQLGKLETHQGQPVLKLNKKNKYRNMYCR